MMNLNSKDKEKLKKIWDNDYQTISNGKDNGVPYLSYVFDLHKKLFGETCSFCPSNIPGYIQRIKNLNPNKMEKKIKKSFVLNAGAMIIVPGTSKSYSNSNLTDEIALEFLSKNPNRKSLFSKLPNDIDFLIKNFKKETSKENDNTDRKSDFVKIGEVELTIEQTISLLEKINIKSKASTVSGLKQAISKLNDLQKAELEKLANEVKDSTKAPEAPITLGEERTKETIEFDLEKAEQDLEDLKTNFPDNETAIETAENNVSKFKAELEKLA